MGKILNYFQDKQLWIAGVIVPLAIAFFTLQPDICSITSCLKGNTVKIFYRETQSNLANVLEESLEKYGTTVKTSEYTKDYGQKLRWYWNTDKDTAATIVNKINSIISKTSYEVRVRGSNHEYRGEGHDKKRFHLYL